MQSGTSRSPPVWRWEFESAYWQSCFSQTQSTGRVRISCLCKVQLWNFVWRLCSTRTFLTLLKNPSASPAGVGADLVNFHVGYIGMLQPSYEISHNSTVMLHPSLFPHQIFLPISMTFHTMCFLNSQLLGKVHIRARVYFLLCCKSEWRDFRIKEEIFVRQSVPSSWEGIPDPLSCPA